MIYNIQVFLSIYFPQKKTKKHLVLFTIIGLLARHTHLIYGYTVYAVINHRFIV